MAKKKINTIILAISIFLLAFIFVSGFLFFTQLNSIAKTSIEKLLSYILQVDVTLKRVHVSILKGSAELYGLVIPNPSGFKTDTAFRADIVKVKADIKSFGTDEPLINLISFQNPKVTLEQGFRSSNLNQLIKNASRFKKDELPDDAPDSASKIIKIDKIDFFGAKVALSAPVLQGNEVAFSLPQFSIYNVGGKKEKITTAQATKLVLVELLAHIIKSGKGIIPPELEETLTESLNAAIKTFQDAASILQDETLRIGKHLSRKGSDAVKKGIDDVTDSIKELLEKD